MEISLLSLNVYLGTYLDRTLPFLESIHPEVACIQELYEEDIEAIAHAVKAANHHFVPMTIRHDDGEPKIMGVAIFSMLSMHNMQTLFYRKRGDQLRDFDMSTPARKHETEDAMVVMADIEKEGSIFRIGTTHFTWTPDGQPSEFQRLDLKKMEDVLQLQGEHILVGDFNAPRGGEIFEALSTHYKDNIPPEYTTSIDGNLHRAGPLPYMVDGLFTTPGYTATNVRLESGVSDHMAIVASITKLDSFRYTCDICLERHSSARKRGS